MTLPANEEHSEQTKESDVRDLSIIGEVSSFLEIPPRPENVALYELEEKTLDSDKLKLQNERQKVEIYSLQQDADLRSSFGTQVLRYLWTFSGFCALAILAQGFHIFGFHIESAPLTTLIGSTAVAAFGLVAVMLRGLFKPPPATEPKKAKKKLKKATKKLIKKLPTTS